MGAPLDSPRFRGLFVLRARLIRPFLNLTRGNRPFSRSKCVFAGPGGGIFRSGACFTRSHRETGRFWRETSRGGTVQRPAERLSHTLSTRGCRPLPWPPATLRHGTKVHTTRGDRSKKPRNRAVTDVGRAPVEPLGSPPYPQDPSVDRPRVLGVAWTPGPGPAGRIFRARPRSPRREARRRARSFAAPPRRSGDRSRRGEGCRARANG